MWRSMSVVGKAVVRVFEVAVSKGKSCSVEAKGYLVHCTPMGEEQYVITVRPDGCKGKREGCNGCE